MKANSKRIASRLVRIHIYAIPSVEQALKEGRISIDNAEIISRYSPGLQELMLPETIQVKRRRPTDKKVVLMPGVAEKKAADQADYEQIAQAMRFEVS